MVHSFLLVETDTISFGSKSICVYLFLTIKRVHLNKDNLFEFFEAPHQVNLEQMLQYLYNLQNSVKRNGLTV